MMMMFIVFCVFCVHSAPLAYSFPSFVQTLWHTLMNTHSHTRNTCMRLWRTQQSEREKMPIEWISMCEKPIWKIAKPNSYFTQTHTGNHLCWQNISRCVSIGIPAFLLCASFSAVDFFYRCLRVCVCESVWLFFSAIFRFVSLQDEHTSYKYTRATHYTVDPYTHSTHRHTNVSKHDEWIKMRLPLTVRCA